MAHEWYISQLLWWNGAEREGDKEGKEGKRQIMLGLVCLSQMLGLTFSVTGSH